MTEIRVEYKRNIKRLIRGKTMFGCVLFDSNISKYGTTYDHGNAGKVFFLQNISCILKWKRRVALKYMGLLPFSDYQW